MLSANKVWRFTYSGGTTPGATRLVFVTEVYDRGFRGYDFDRDGFRTFSARKVSDEWNVFAQVIDLDALPDKVDINDLQDDYEGDDYLVYRDLAVMVVVKDNRVVTAVEPRESLSLTYSNDKGTVVVTVDDFNPAVITTYTPEGVQVREQTQSLGSAGMVLAKVLT